MSFESGFQSLGWKAPKMVFPSHSQIKPCENLTWEALLEHWLLLKVFACATCVSVLKLQPPFCIWTWLEGKRHTFVLLQDPDGNFCLSRCFPFDQCDSFNVFFPFNLRWLSLSGDSRRAHSICPASELPFQQQTFFSCVYLTVLDHCEAIPQAIMQVLHFSVIAFHET